MKKNELFFLSADNKTNIHMVIWEPENKPVGVVQIVHGVTEHIMRYEEMADFFTDRDVAVVGIDLLGHGLSTNNGEKKMYFGPAGSWNYVVKDIDECYRHVKELYPDVPYTMLGFSLGSFLARTYLINYPGNVDAAILVGTGYNSDIEVALAKSIVKKEAKKYGEDVATDKIKELTFDTYNKKFKPNRTDYDWLCLSNTMLDQYIADELRGGVMSVGLFREMLDGIKYTCNIKNMKRMNINNPILFLSGTMDPVGNFGKGVEQVVKAFKKVGVNECFLKMYDNLRHDILHEDERLTIYEDIYSWLLYKKLVKEEVVPGVKGVMMSVHDVVTEKNNAEKVEEPKEDYADIVLENVDVDTVVNEQEVSEEVNEEIPEVEEKNDDNLVALEDTSTDLKDLEFEDFADNKKIKGTEKDYQKNKKKLVKKHEVVSLLHKGDIPRGIIKK